jgi:hypothetical protein
MRTSIREAAMTEPIAMPAMTPPDKAVFDDGVDGELATDELATDELAEVVVVDRLDAKVFGTKAEVAGEVVDDGVVMPT